MDIGGLNLPRTISSSLGSKLAKIYKERGITDLQQGIGNSLKILNCFPSIERNDDRLEVKINFPDSFCPIGGERDPEKADLVQESICKPYSLGFIKEYLSNENYDLVIEKCMLEENEEKCHYTLRRK